MTRSFTREVTLEVKLIVRIVSLSSVNIKYRMLHYAIQGGPVAVTVTTYTPYKKTHAEICLGKCSSNNGCLRCSKTRDTVFLESAHYFASEHVLYLHLIRRKLLFFSAGDDKKANFGSCCLLLAWGVRQWGIPLLFSPKFCSVKWLFCSSDVLQLGCFKYLNCSAPQKIILLLTLHSYWQRKTDIAAEMLWVSPRNVNLDERGVWLAMKLVPFSHCRPYSFPSLFFCAFLVFLLHFSFLHLFSFGIVMKRSLLSAEWYHEQWNKRCLSCRHPIQSFTHPQGLTHPCSVRSDCKLLTALLLLLSYD